MVLPSKVPEMDLAALKLDVLGGLGNVQLAARGEGAARVKLVCAKNTASAAREITTMSRVELCDESTVHVYPIYTLPRPALQ